MKRIGMFTGISVLTLLALSGGALGQETRKGVLRNIIVVFQPPNPEEQRQIATQVNLTEEQRGQMKAVSERYRADAQTLRGKYATAYRDVVRLMQQTEPNKSTVNSKLKAFHNVHQQVVSHEVQYWMDFKSILTPEQNKKFWNVFEQKRIRR